jgi:hypothetical protein
MATTITLLQGWTAFDYPTRGNKVGDTRFFRSMCTHGPYSTVLSIGDKSISQVIILMPDVFPKLPHRRTRS